MDLAEKLKTNNRHPWELSRAHCLLDVIKKYTMSTVADIGAGDRFFTKKLAAVVSGSVYAVDTGYSEKEEGIYGIHCFDNISELPEAGLNAVALISTYALFLRDFVCIYRDYPCWLYAKKERTPMNERTNQCFSATEACNVFGS